MSDKPIPPSVAEHALQSCLSENGEQIGMAATIAQQAELIERLARVAASFEDGYAYAILRDEIAALKRDGVIIPGPIAGNEMGEYGAAMRRGYDACRREVARLNASRGGVPDKFAMARTLSDRCADSCNIDRDDYWKQYGQDTIEDVDAMLAAPTPPASEAVPNSADPDALLVRMREKYENAHAMAQFLIAARTAQRTVIERTIDRLEHGHEHNKALIELRALLANGGDV
jgi:hypothetical protein